MSERKRQAVIGNNAVDLGNVYYGESGKNNLRNQQKEQDDHRRHKRHGNPVYTVSLALIIMVTLAIAVILLKAQFVVSDNAENIIALQQNLLEIKKQNSQLASDIERGINMDDVYKIATNELGMVQAGEDNIQFIAPKELSYTVQYADVKVNEEDDNLSIANILGFISKGW